MDRLADLFSPSVQQILIAQSGIIRKYRHWHAHGKRGAIPGCVQPLFAYSSLTNFLTAWGLT